MSVVTVKIPGGFQTYDDEDDFAPDGRDRDEIRGGVIGGGDTAQESMDDYCNKMDLPYSMVEEEE